MTGSELRRIRNSLDLSRVEFGRALGYRGENVSRMVRRLEDGERKITEEIAEIATKLGEPGLKLRVRLKDRKRRGYKKRWRLEVDRASWR